MRGPWIAAHFFHETAFCFKSVFHSSLVSRILHCRRSSNSRISFSSESRHTFAFLKRYFSFVQFELLWSSSVFHEIYALENTRLRCFSALESACFSRGWKYMSRTGKCFIAWEVLLRGREVASEGSCHSCVAWGSTNCFTKDLSICSFFSLILLDFSNHFWIQRLRLKTFFSHRVEKPRRYSSFLLKWLCLMSLLILVHFQKLRRWSTDRVNRQCKIIMWFLPRSKPIFWSI